MLGLQADYFNNTNTYPPFYNVPYSKLACVWARCSSSCHYKRVSLLLVVQVYIQFEVITGKVGVFLRSWSSTNNNKQVVCSIAIVLDDANTLSTRTWLEHIAIWEQVWYVLAFYSQWLSGGSSKGNMNENEVWMVNLSKDSTEKWHIA